MSKSTKDAGPSTIIDQPSADSPVVGDGGLSRQKKIAVVIFLTLSGFFLMDERSVQSPAPMTSPELELTGPELHGLLQDADAPDPSTTSEETQLRLPSAETTAIPSDNLAWADTSSDVRASEANVHPAALPRDQRGLTNDDGPEVASPSRPRLRFSGRIEPLY